MADRLIYFAYGSNMHPLRLWGRVPSGRAIGTGSLTGHALRFHKRGVDGSGKCNALRTGRAWDAVEGVLYEITRQERRQLDLAESLGSGYARETVRIVSNDEGRRAFTYFAQSGYIDSDLHPFTWYKAFVVAGARFHRLPLRYVEALECAHAVEDPDVTRAEANFRILRKVLGRRAP